MRTRGTDHQRKEAAEALCLRALSFLVEDPERLSRFLALTGLGPEELRARASDPALLGGVLDHLLADERLLLAFRKQPASSPRNRRARGRCCRARRRPTKG